MSEQKKYIVTTEAVLSTKTVFLASNEGEAFSKARRDIALGKIQYDRELDLRVERILSVELKEEDGAQVQPNHWSGS